MSEILLNLTREQAIQEHRKMWNWIADELEKLAKLPSEDTIAPYSNRKHKDVFRLKEKYCDLKNIYVKNYCFACHYTWEIRRNDEDFNRKIKSCDCRVCPFKWGTENEVEEYFCDNGIENPYYKPDYERYMKDEEDYKTDMLEKQVGLWSLADQHAEHGNYLQAAEVARQIANLPEKI